MDTQITHLYPFDSHLSSSRNMSHRQQIRHGAGGVERGLTCGNRERSYCPSFVAASWPIHSFRAAIERFLFILSLIFYHTSS